MFLDLFPLLHALPPYLLSSYLAKCQLTAGAQPRAVEQLVDGGINDHPLYL